MLQATTVASQQLLTQQITLKGPAKCHTVYSVPIEVLSARIACARAVLLVAFDYTHEAKTSIQQYNCYQNRYRNSKSYSVR